MTRREYCRRWCDPTYSAQVHAEAARIKSDGCSGVTQAYRVVCEEHDSAYARHCDLYTGLPVTEEEADLMLKWGVQWHSWFGKASVVAWFRYKGLSKVAGLGLGSKAWETGPARLATRLRG